MSGVNQLGFWAAAVGNFNVADDNYFGNLQNYYCDTNEVLAPGDQIVNGIAFIQKGNRLAVAIYCILPDGSGGQWKLPPMGNDGNYFGSIGGFYVDTNPVFVPSGQVIKAVQFYPKGNRIALRIWCTDPRGTNAGWVEGSQDNDSNYFGPLGGLYADTNPVILETPPNQPQGVGLWQLGNRVAPYLITGSEDGSFPPIKA